MSFEDFIRDEQYAMLQMRKRQYALEAMEAELRSVTKDADFAIANDIVWQAMLDTRDANVIALASWCKGAGESGGFFGRLKGQHAHRFPVSRPWRSSDPVRETRQGERFSADYTALRNALFPFAVDRTLQHSDVDELRSAFDIRVAPLLRDRHANRAHPFEKSGRGQAKMLAFAETRALYTEVFQLLNDLSVLVTGSTLAGVDLTFASPQATAVELIDIVLLPPWFRRLCETSGRAREEVYDELHSGAQPGRLFNDLAAIEKSAAPMRGTAPIRDRD